MTKTYRALGVAAIVTLICLALQVVYIIWLASEPFGAAGPVDVTPTVVVLLGLWPQVARLFAPIISTFSVVVASQARDRRWISVFVAVGILSSFGASLSFWLPPAYHDFFLRIDLSMHNNMPPAGTLADDIFNQVILQAIPAVAALIFVGMKLRASVATQGAAGQAPQA